MGQRGGAVSKKGKAPKDSWLFDCRGLEYLGLSYFSGQKLWARAGYVDMYVSIYQTLQSTLCMPGTFLSTLKNINVN